MQIKQRTTSDDILIDVLRSAGVGLQIIATGEKVSGRKKLKTFVAVVSGEVLSSIFSRFQSSVEDANSASEPLTRQNTKQPKTQPRKS